MEAESPGTAGQVAEATVMGQGPAAAVGQAGTCSGGKRGSSTAGSGPCMAQGIQDLCERPENCPSIVRGEGDGEGDAWQTEKDLPPLTRLLCAKTFCADGTGEGTLLDVRGLPHVLALWIPRGALAPRGLGQRSARLGTVTVVGIRSVGTGTGEVTMDRCGCGGGRAAWGTGLTSLGGMRLFVDPPPGGNHAAPGGNTRGTSGCAGDCAIDCAIGREPGCGESVTVGMRDGTGTSSGLAPWVRGWFIAEGSLR